MKNRKRIAALTVAALAAALALSACGSASSPGTGANDVAKVATVKTLTPGVLAVGSDLTYPPYDTLNGNAPAGFDVDFMNAMATELGVKTNFINTRFAQVVAGIQANRYDVIASTLYVSTARSKQVDFVPYFDTGNSILVAAGQPALATAQSLCGKTVGVVTATVIATILPGSESDKCKANGKQPITVKQYPTDPEATQALLAHQVDAQMTDAAVAKTVVGKTNGAVAMTSTKLIYPVAVGLAVRKGNTQLANGLTAGLAAMKASGAYAKLLKQYNLDPVDPAVLAQSLAQG
ncbi:ABC transporter substrate-binding protein [Arthrobacter sp. SDTb3-6]|uniref:ABC transporter substrate-binding protein n=1 Tax=Arthrobacter sp. SDTb3-6 TaxID=2713571 RepID=UPI00159E8170|nr:ABC transporter substrate-binding protein [Arthrobacter sp. SDTb3-6]NVN00406.1 ABC transporter substrate-binding protein [Arthrobacter sp. SDTb3-6]